MACRAFSCIAIHLHDEAKLAIGREFFRPKSPALAMDWQADCLGLGLANRLAPAKIEANILL